MNKKHRYSSPYLARDYFAKDILPHALYVGRRTIRQNIPYRQLEEISFILVRKGTGTITVNAHSYPVRPGSLLCLNPTQFHRIDLDRGCVLEISECHVNSGLYFYITACPYYENPLSEVPVPPVFAQLDDPMTDHVTALLDELSLLGGKSPVSENQPAFFLLMKLFGILEEYAQA